ncbi:lipid II:glycine glycyltransferase FemX [Halorarius halobius]|uniref:lipid II:glycine glycyltransferase FemX n=1 Tax=Halorarius halobius TaxID=2962671 RepID=UPI0020CD219E|nr:GNAT family N-acetyltransferase [Halorarius halobius]
MSDTDLELESYDTVTAVNENQWNNLVEQSDIGSVFQRYGWLRAIEEGLGRDVRHVVVAKKGNPVALLPNIVRELPVPVDAPLLDRLPMRQLVSTAPGYGGPVVGSDERTTLSMLLDAVARDGRGTVQHALRTGRAGSLRYGKRLLSRGYRPDVVTGRFVLDLTDDWDGLLGTMSRSRRQAIRRALDGDYEVSVGPLEDVAAFYDDYAANIERVGGDPFPRRFLTALSDHLADRLLAVTVTVDGTVVGRYLYLVDEERSTLHHYLPGVGSEEHFEHAPSERLHAHAIQWALEEGYDHYDLGSTSADFTDSQFRYKEGYGGRFVPTIEWERGRAPLRWGAYRLARDVYRRFAYE